MQSIIYFIYYLAAFVKYLCVGGNFGPKFWTHGEVSSGRN